MKQLDLRIAGRYQLQRRIGGGAFGSVYIATNIETGEEVALKLEHIDTYPSFLELEVEYLQLLAGGVGIPRVREYLTECDYNVMVLDLLGPSLEDLFNFCRRHFSLKTVLMLADQLLRRLEYIHSKDLIHRDVKPENFLMGTGRCGNLVYATDMGLATERRDFESQAKPAGGSRRRLIGTARFASVRGHLGVVQHRPDDMESLGYMFVYFLRGFLPWQGLKAQGRLAKDELILEKKMTVSVEELCKDLPREFATYFDHIRSLKYDGTPKYAHLRTIFHNLFVREGFEVDHVYDWTILKYLMSTEGMEATEDVGARPNKDDAVPSVMASHSTEAAT